MAEISVIQRKQQAKMIETLARKTHFHISEVDGLLALHRKLCHGADHQQHQDERLDRTRFREFLHNAFDMTDDIILDRIFKRFDADNDGYVGRDEWIHGLSVFLKGPSVIVEKTVHCTMLKVRYCTIAELPELHLSSRAPLSILRSDTCKVLDVC